MTNNLAENSRPTRMLSIGTKSRNKKKPTVSFERVHTFSLDSFYYVLSKLILCSPSCGNTQPTIKVKKNEPPDLLGTMYKSKKINNIQ